MLTLGVLIPFLVSLHVHSFPPPHVHGSMQQDRIKHNHVMLLLYALPHDHIVPRDHVSLYFHCDNQLETDQLKMVYKELGKRVRKKTNVHMTPLPCACSIRSDQDVG